MAIALAERIISSKFNFQEDSKESNPLLRHIDYFRKNWRQEGLPMNWADLPGTGFMIGKQINLVFSEIKPEDNLPLKKEKIRKGLNQTEQDIKGFILEYLAEGLVFPMHYQISSEGELIDANYGNKKVTDIVSSQERNGVVKETLSKKIEPFLVNSQDGSIAIMISPSGWSGLYQEDGQLINFSDSQTYIWQKRGKEVLGFTIRTDFNSKEHGEVLRRLNKELPIDASIIDYIANPALVYPDEKQNIRSIEDVVGVMRDTRIDMYSGYIFAYKDRMWDEVYHDLNRREELWKFDKVTQKMVQELKEYVLESDLSKESVKEALAVTILRIAKFLRTKSTWKEPVQSPSRWQNGLMEGVALEVGYGKVLSEVQKLPGCAGGGNSKNLIKSITPRFGEWFTCPKCKHQADGPIGDGPCPGCGLTKEEFAKESSEPICE